MDTLMKKYKIIEKIEIALEKFIERLQENIKETPGMAYAIFQGLIWFSLFFLITCIR